jgi:hypothetical protein
VWQSPRERARSHFIPPTSCRMLSSPTISNVLERSSLSTLSLAFSWPMSRQSMYSASARARMVV